MPTTLKLDGVEELLAAMAALAPDLTAAAGALEATIASAAVTDLRAAVPVVTGTLRRSIQVKRGASSGTRVSTAIVVGAPYAHFVEFGTRYVRARPALVPIARRARQTFVKAVADRVRQEGLTVTGEGA